MRVEIPGLKQYPKGSHGKGKTQPQKKCAMFALYLEGGCCGRGIGLYAERTVSWQTSVVGIALVQLIYSRSYFVFVTIW